MTPANSKLAGFFLTFYNIQLKSKQTAFLNQGGKKMHLFLRFLLVFSSIYLTGALITYCFLRQEFSANIAKWKKALNDGQQIQLDETDILYKEADIATYMHRHGRWAIFFSTLLWFVVLRPLIRKKLNKEF